MLLSFEVHSKSKMGSGSRICKVHLCFHLPGLSRQMRVYLFLEQARSSANPVSLGAVSSLGELKAPSVFGWLG